MITAIHKRLEDREEGFTLIELLVVVIIIGILAAIAIPTFLNQREKGWQAAVDSDLRNAAVTMETNYTEDGVYKTGSATGKKGDTAAVAGTGGLEDFNASEQVTVTATLPDGEQSFCLTGEHANLSVAAVTGGAAASGFTYYDSTAGGITDTAC